jgi:hypothetical protein
MSHRPIFLSSCLVDLQRRPLPIRRSIQMMTGGPAPLPANVQRPIWMAEDFPNHSPPSPWGGLATVELCLDGIRAAECVVAVLTSRYGTAVPIGEVGIVPSSYLEAELFEAALLGKPTYIYLLEGAELDPKLSTVLQLLKPSFPGMDLDPVPEKEILRRVERLLKQYARPRWMRPLWPLPRLRETVDTLFGARHRPYDPAKQAPSIRFLDGASDATLSPPDPSVVETVLQRAAQPSSNHLQLTFLWFAIRALMGAPYTERRYANFADLWARALGRWASAGAWFGLHGHLHMGCLAALGSLAELQLQRAEPDKSGVALPHGPFASEYYSIAKHAGQRDAVLDIALGHIEAALASPHGDHTGHAAIRASIYREMGRMDAALADYTQVAEARREQGGPAYGEALSELGYAALLAGDRRRGVELMEQGLERLRAGPMSGFRIRAIRKLAVGYARRGKISAAVDLAVEAHDAAVVTGAHDQIRGLEKLAKHLDRGRFWRRRRDPG